MFLSYRVTECVCVLLLLFCDLMRNTSKSSPHHGARVGGGGGDETPPEAFLLCYSLVRYQETLTTF